VFFDNSTGTCVCPFSEVSQGELECYKTNCTFEHEYLNNLPSFFVPDKKDEIGTNLIKIYGWGNGDSLIQNLATSFVNLLVQYPECLIKLQGGPSYCSDDQFRTIDSLMKGISKYRCNVDPPSAVLSSEVPPSETPPIDNPPSETPPGE
jgi:hypothetical protein